MSLITGNIIKENISLYRFVSTIISGKVLDYQNYSFSSYYGAKILLDSGISEVIHHNLIDGNGIFSKRILSDKKIKFFSVDKDEIKHFDKSFDSIISFGTINHQNYNAILNYFFKLLKNNGVLIVSTFNKNHKGDQSERDLDNMGFSKEEFLKTLKAKFFEVNIYSYRLSDKDQKVSKLFSLIGTFRKAAASSLLKIDKNRQFYIKNLQSTMQKVNRVGDNLKKIPDDDFIPKPYTSNPQPIYFLAVCKTIKNE